jgi:hypothetical protein
MHTEAVSTAKKEFSGGSSRSQASQPTQTTDSSPSMSEPAVTEPSSVPTYTKETSPFAAMMRAKKEAAALNQASQEVDVREKVMAGVSPITQTNSDGTQTVSPSQSSQVSASSVVVPEDNWGAGVPKIAEDSEPDCEFCSA